MQANRLVASFFLLLLGACAQEEQSAIESPPYRPVNDMLHLMERILDPAADVIWDSAGTIITTEGSQELAPTTDEGWEQVARNAAILAETGNLLMLPGRSVGDDWVEYSSGLIDAGVLALEAAEKHDGDALFDAGGRIYQVCLACHNQYVITVGDNNE